MTRPRSRPPFRWCDDCGVLVGRSWREFVLCDACREKRRARRESWRRAGDAAYVAGLGRVEPPEPAPHDDDPLGDPFEGMETQ